MEVYKYIIVFVVAFLTLLIMDYVWLGIVTKDFIIREFGNMVVVEEGSIKIRLWVGLLAWAIISSMIVIFVTLQFTTYKEIALYGALLGCMSYAMYDLTNLTFLKNYSTIFTVVDIAWGTFVGMMVAVTSFYAYSLFQ